MRTLVASLALALALAACAKQENDEPGPAAGPDHSISVEEVARGVTACETWVERLCACAEKDPQHAEACEQARPIPDAFTMAVRTANAASVEGEVRARLQREARKIAARCLEETARLPCR